MHILTTTSASLDDLIEPVDLRQTPGDIVFLSFTDSDLAGMAAAWKSDPSLPSLRLAALRDLRHPMSVDLWIDTVARHAKVILVRILGGYDWWRYGCDQLAAIARTHGIKLAFLPGECREEDLRLIEASTLSREDLASLLEFFREGGPDNMRLLAGQLAGLARGRTAPAKAVEVPKAGFYAQPPLPSPLWGGSRNTCSEAESVTRGGGADCTDTPPPALRADPPHKGEGRTPIIPFLFYRSMLLDNDIAPLDAMTKGL
ncbi:MAG: cobaltochelatase subunit CobN, partial [Rhizobiaceae bacterium]